MCMAQNAKLSRASTQHCKLKLLLQFSESFYVSNTQTLMLPVYAIRTLNENEMINKLTLKVNATSCVVNSGLIDTCNTLLPTQL